MRQSFSVGSLIIVAEHNSSIATNGTTSFVEQVERSLDHAVFRMTRGLKSLPTNIKNALVDIRNPERRKSRRRLHILGCYPEMFAECMKAGASLVDALAPLYAFIRKAVQYRAQRIELRDAIKARVEAEYKARLAELEVTDGHITLSDITNYREVVQEKQVLTEVELAVCDRIASELSAKEAA